MPPPCCAPPPPKARSRTSTKPRRSGGASPGTPPPPCSPPTGTAHPTDPLHPDWLPALTTSCGQAATDQLLADPHWPAVVTALNRGLQHGIPPTDLLRVPTGPDGHPGPRRTPSPTRSSTRRSPSPTRHPTTPTSSPSTPTTTPPEDLHLLTTTLQANTPGQPARHPPGLPPRRHRPRPAADARTATASPPTSSPCPKPNSTRNCSTPPTPAPGCRPGNPATSSSNGPSLEQPKPSSPPSARSGSPTSTTQAAAFYQHTYPGSWAQTYLRERLAGTDLTGDPCIQPGYAPPGWTTLTAHLRRHGATDQELLAAGLAKHASTGRLIDTFRDRLILPIHHHDQIIGFIARRNPDTDNADVQHTAKAGPKYLNTSETVLFSKGEQLYGMAEHADRLA